MTKCLLLCPIVIWSLAPWDIFYIWIQTFVVASHFIANPFKNKEFTFSPGVHRKMLKHLHKLPSDYFLRCGYGLSTQLLWILREPSLKLMANVSVISQPFFLVLPRYGIYLVCQKYWGKDHRCTNCCFQIWYRIAEKINSLDYNDCTINLGRAWILENALFSPLNSHTNSSLKQKVRETCSPVPEL